MKISLEVDGKDVEFDAEPRMLLGQLLRDDADAPLRLDCETSTCGACTVLLDGAPVKSCALLAVMADGESITTSEGLTEAYDVPAVRALTDDVLPCGECRGAVQVVVASVARSKPAASRSDYARALSGTVCRCTGYQVILDAIVAATGDQA